MLVGEIDVIKDTLEEKEVHWIIPIYLVLNVDELHEAPTIKFLDATFSLALYPFELDNHDHIGLRINTDEVKSSNGMKFTLGIKKSDGSIFGNDYFKHNFPNIYINLIIYEFIDKNTLIQNRSELVSSNNLVTIVCNFKTGSLMDSKKFSELYTLSEDMKRLLTERKFCDVTLIVKEKVFQAHRGILSYRSPVFSAMFKHEMSEKQNGTVHIPDCDPDSFFEFLTFLYSAQLDNVSSHNALQLYKTAHKYDVRGLMKFCIKCMKNNLKVENVCGIILLAEEYDEMDILPAAQAFLNKNLSDIIISDGWKDLVEKNFNLANKLLMQMNQKIKL